MKIVVDGPENGDRFLCYMGFLDWLETIDFFEEEVNYVSREEIHKTIL